MDTGHVAGVKGKTLTELAQLADEKWRANISHPSVNSLRTAATSDLETGVVVAACYAATHINPGYDSDSRHARSPHKKGAGKKKKTISARSKSRPADGDCCYYHTKFGDAARHCKEPCKYYSEN